MIHLQPNCWSPGSPLERWFCKSRFKTWRIWSLISTRNDDSIKKKIKIAVVQEESSKLSLLLSMVFLTNPYSRQIFTIPHHANYLQKLPIGWLPVSRVHSIQVNNSDPLVGRQPRRRQNIQPCKSCLHSGQNGETHKGLEPKGKKIWHSRLLG